MNKELVTIEFRYDKKNITEDRTDYIKNTITVGMFDTLEEAIVEGNKALEVLSKTFQVRPEDKFKKNHLWGMPLRLVTNCCYPTKGVQYFASITQLKFDDINETVNEIFK